MTQSDFGTINPVTTSGPDFATQMEGHRDAANSDHKGPSRPAYAVAGMTWADDATADRIFLKIFDGLQDIELFEIDTVNNVVVITIPLATAAAKGLASPAQISKLDGIATGANLYSHPNHSGDVTSTGDGATAIGANKVTTAKINNAAVTLAKMANVATASILGRNTAATGVPEVLSAFTARAVIGGNAAGVRTVSTLAPSGGADGDVWYQF